MLEIQADFDAGAAGAATIAARAELLDGIVRELWAAELTKNKRLATGVTLLAVGGYGRRELFPPERLPRRT
jgi:[protein-PII] uridylyltransferase